MAKVIFKTNLATKNYFVESKVVDTPINENINVSRVQLTISPRSGYSVEAKDFTSGFLPSQVTGIKYSDLNGKVSVLVSLANFVVKQKTTTIVLPISGISRLPINKYILIDVTPIDKNILVQDSSSGSSKLLSTENQKTTTYTFDGGYGEKRLVLRKIFSLPNNYYFSKQPTYTISGDVVRYSVTSSVTKDSRGRITGDRKRVV